MKRIDFKTTIDVFARPHLALKPSLYILIWFSMVLRTCASKFDNNNKVDADGKYCIFICNTLPLFLTRPTLSQLWSFKIHANIKFDDYETAKGPVGQITGYDRRTVSQWMHINDGLSHPAAG